MPKSKPTVAVVIPNWNGKEKLKSCLEALLVQTVYPQIIVVENGSTDGSLDYLRENYPQIKLVINSHNRGFAGGVNDGIKEAVSEGYEYVALINNDAVAAEDWLEKLLGVLRSKEDYGIATSKIIKADSSNLDSTGDFYTNWGLPYPRGRGETDLAKYDHETEVFGASGGASLYRYKMLEEIGLFDEDFFAYYEDVDLSFRAQLAGWKVIYVPSAHVYHEIGGTSSKLPGFAAKQTIKNLPLLFWKNVPRRYLFTVGWRFWLAHSMFTFRAITRGQIWPTLSGCGLGLYLMLKKTGERRRIQASKKVSDEYIWNVITHDLPVNAHKLRNLRTAWWAAKGQSK